MKQHSSSSSNKRLHDVVSHSPLTSFIKPSGYMPSASVASAIERGADVDVDNGVRCLFYGSGG
eukprot:scaffold6143_cov147-Skeletonema_dohrnii-CCMP3373.AAC.2